MTSAVTSEATNISPSPTPPRSGCLCGRRPARRGCVRRAPPACTSPRPGAGAARRGPRPPASRSPCGRRRSGTPGPRCRYRRRRPGLPRSAARAAARRAAPGAVQPATVPLPGFKCPGAGLHAITRSIAEPQALRPTDRSASNWATKSASRRSTRVWSSERFHNTPSRPGTSPQALSKRRRSKNQPRGKIWTPGSRLGAIYRNT